jgi:hypothetical protein
MLVKYGRMRIFFFVVSGLDRQQQRFISRMIGLANPPYTHQAHTQATVTSSTATSSASTPGSARVSANITTTTSASVSMNAPQRSNDHATALMAALQSQPVQPASPSHKASVVNRSFYNFHSSSFYNKQSLVCSTIVLPFLPTIALVYALVIWGNLSWQRLIFNKLHICLHVCEYPFTQH